MSPDAASARLPGTDVPFVEWSPIATRAPLRWPNGAHVAVAVIVSVEHLEMQPPQGASITPSAIGYGPYPNTYQIVRVSGAEYGSRVGAFRILNALEATGIRPMVAMDAGLFDERVRLVEEFLKRGAEFLGHGISLSRALGEELDPTDEASQIATSLDTVQRATGRRPVGWLGAGYGESTRTVEVLSGLGVRYVCDWANDEQPYRMHVRDGSMTALPVAVDLDDVMVEEVRRLPAWRRAAKRPRPRLGVGVRTPPPDKSCPHLPARTGPRSAALGSSPPVSRVFSSASSSSRPARNVGQAATAPASRCRWDGVGPGQRCHEADHLGEHSYQRLALQVGHVMVQLISQWRQRPAPGSADCDFVHQMTGWRLRQQLSR